ncbi:MEDS domain-containing protein [Nitrospira sp. Nam80]
MVKLSHIARFGLPGINRVPFGMHVCDPYTNREELVAALVPYLVAGLRGEERCLWVTAPPLPASEAVHALRSAWSGVGDAIHGAALRRPLAPRRAGSTT